MTERKKYLEKIKTLAEDFASIVDLNRAIYQKKISDLLLDCPVREFLLEDVIFLLCKGIKDECGG